MDIIDILREDHRHIKQLLSSLASTSEGDMKARSDILERLDSALKLHGDLEKEVFYPAFREAGQGRNEEAFAQALEEHSTFEEGPLARLAQCDTGSVDFTAKVLVLKQLVEMHLAHEEKAIFSQARKIMGQARLHEIGQEFMARRTEKYTHSAPSTPHSSTNAPFVQVEVKEMPLPPSPTTEKEEFHPVELLGGVAGEVARATGALVHQATKGLVQGLLTPQSEKKTPEEPNHTPPH